MPVVAVCDGCNAEYRLRDEHAGSKVRCKQCGTIILVPFSDGLEDELEIVEAKNPGPFGHDQYLINQKLVSISEKYYVYDVEQRPILFIERPAHFMQSIGAGLATALIAIGGIIGSIVAAVSTNRPDIPWLYIVVAVLGLSLTLFCTLAVYILLIPKRHISVYTDDTKEDLLLEVFQDRKVNLITATYTIRDPNDGHLGQLKKNNLYDFFRKRWDVYGPDGTPLVVAREDSLILSLMRRLFGPQMGLLRTNFVFYHPESETVIGEFNRKFTLFDRYVLDLSADRRHALDRRIAVALGVLLDTGEYR